MNKKLPVYFLLFLCLTGLKVFSQKSSGPLNSIRSSSLIPVADFSVNDSVGCAPLIVDFLNLSSGATNYLWDFGDGTTSTDTTVSHTFTSAGTYKVKLYAYEGLLADSDSIVIQVNFLAPLAADSSRCDSGIVELTAVGADSLYWYDASSGGTLLYTGQVFTTPLLNSTNTYYVETGDSVCRSIRVPVRAIIDSLPLPPVSSNVSRCDSGTVTLMATATESLSWYDAPAGTIPVATGPMFTSPVLTATTTYYVEAGNTCGSNRIPVQAIIINSPPSPTGSDSSKCGPSSVTLAATGTGTISWYTDSVGGTFLGTGSSYTSPVLSSTTTYYAEDNNGCVSQTRTGIQAIIYALPIAPAGSDVVRCDSGQVTLTATAVDSLFWFDAPVGGNQIHTGSTFTTPFLNSTTSYYVESGNADCRSSRILIRAVINQIPQVPVATNSSRCDPGTVLLNAQSSDTIFWYDAMTGGVLIHTGPSYTTPFINTTTSYYIESGNSNCRSSRIEIQAIISGNPPAPLAANVSFCGSANVTLTATATDSIFWYDAPAAGNLLQTGNTYTTPVISASTTYYVEAGGQACRSTRIPVMAVLRTSPAPPTVTNNSRCGPGSLTLTANSTDSIFWFSGSSGNNYLDTGSSYMTPVINITTTYYVESGNGCRSTRIPVQAIILSAPAAPVGSDDSLCGEGTITLSVTGAGNISWYSSATGNSLIGTGPTYNTSVISNTTTYYAEANNGCPSASRTAIRAVVLPLPTGPNTSDVFRCSPGTVLLSASSNGTLYWYDSPAGGNLLHTGSNFTTPPLSITTSYYVEARNTYCTTIRIEVQAIISSIPADPLTADVSRCNAGTVTLSASSPSQLSWYNAAVGGTLLDTTPFFTTQPINTTTTYYVQAGIGCVSNRVPVKAIVIYTPAPPVISDGSRCGPGSVILNGTASGRINWYDSAIGGVLLDTGNVFYTPGITSTTTFYADAGLECPSTRVAVEAVVLPQPFPPVVTNDSICGAGTLTLMASSPDLLKWYDDPFGGTLIGTGSTYTTPFLNFSSTYYVEAGDQCVSTRVPVEAVVSPQNSFQIVQYGSRCGPGTVLIGAVSDAVVYWYDAAVGGNLLDTGATFTTPYLTASQTFYAVAGHICPSAPVSILATVFSTVFIDLGPDSVVIQSGQSITLDPGPGFSNYQWSTGETTQTIEVNSTGSYFVTVRDHNGCYSSDIIFVEVLVGTEKSIEEPELLIYPNPARDQLSIAFGHAKNEDLSISIFSPEGRMILAINEFSGEPQLNVDLSKFSPGIYFLMMRLGELNLCKRFMIER